MCWKILLPEHRHHVHIAVCEEKEFAKILCTYMLTRWAPRDKSRFMMLFLNLGGISPFKYAMICHSILRKFNMPRISNRPKDHIIQLNGSCAKYCNALLGCIRVHLRVPWPMEGPQEGSEGWFEVSYPKTHEKKHKAGKQRFFIYPGNQNNRAGPFPLVKMIMQFIDNYAVYW